MNFHVGNIGVIEAAGNDRIDFFNRMSTNDLTKFEPNKFRKTVFTNDKGRIIAFVNLLNTADKTYIITSPSSVDDLIEHLDKYIIMDDVKLERSNTDYSLVKTWGDDAIETVQKIYNTTIGKNNSFVIPEANVFVYFDSFRFESVNILCPLSKLDDLTEKMTGAKRFTDEEYNTFRIEKGLASSIHELNDNINPVECGLNEYISYTKGCFIGQEVIARLDSQGKIPKQMIKVYSENGITEQDKIYDDEKKEVGFISSTAKNNNDTIALGFIRSVNLDFDKMYTVKHGDKNIDVKISKAI